MKTIEKVQEERKYPFIDGNEICLHEGYWIELSRCDDASKLLQLVRHLTEKDWFTIDVCRLFIELTCEYHEIRLYLHPCFEAIYHDEQKLKNHLGKEEVSDVCEWFIDDIIVTL